MSKILMKVVIFREMFSYCYFYSCFIEKSIIVFNVMTTCPYTETKKKGKIFCHTHKQMLLMNAVV